MAWIKSISYENADSTLKKIYDRVKGPDGQIDNILKVHSLRPHTLTGHMMLYKNVLHHTGNTLPKWYLEAIGVFVSLLNECQYCIDHHYEGMKKLLNDDRLADAIYRACLVNDFSPVMNEAYGLGMNYSETLTLQPKEVSIDMIHKMKITGLEEGEILEINQVTAYFNYVNRTVLGLGVNTNGEVLGLSPGDPADPDSWSHY